MLYICRIIKSSHILYTPESTKNMPEKLQSVETYHFRRTVIFWIHFNPDNFSSFFFTNFLFSMSFPPNYSVISLIKFLVFLTKNHYNDLFLHNFLANILKRTFNKFPYTVAFSSSNNEVFWLIMLQHHPHCLKVYKKIVAAYVIVFGGVNTRRLQ